MQSDNNVEVPELRVPELRVAVDTHQYQQRLQICPDPLQNDYFSYCDIQKIGGSLTDVRCKLCRFKE